MSIPKSFYVICTADTYTKDYQDNLLSEASKGDTFKVHLHEETEEYFTTDHANREMYIAEADVHGVINIRNCFELLTVGRDNFKYQYVE